MKNMNNTTVVNPNDSCMPIIDFGGKIDSSSSNRTPPLHSDDEVTPRRGLECMMSLSKLEDLELGRLN